MDDLALIQQYASSYGLTMTETMWMFLKQGNWDGIYDNLTPDSEYYCYAYGVTDSLEYLTVVCKKDFRTLAIQKVDCTFDLSVDVGHDLAQTVERFAQRIDDPAEHLFADFHFHRFARRIDVIAEPNPVFARKKDGTDAVVLQVERERLVTAPHVEQFVVLHVGKPRYFYDAVARIDDLARRPFLTMIGNTGDLFFQFAADFVQIDHNVLSLQ